MPDHCHEIQGDAVEMQGRYKGDTVEIYAHLPRGDDLVLVLRALLEHVEHQVGEGAHLQP